MEDKAKELTEHILKAVNVPNHPIRDIIKISIKKALEEAKEEGFKEGLKSNL